MNLRPIKADMTELELGDKTILFSYQTPVAYHEHGVYYMTTKYFSRTTSRHINIWLHGKPPLPVRQEVLDGMIK